MAKVTVQPSGFVLDLEDGETVLEAAWRYGIDWPSLCGGMAECSTCHVKILEGRDTLPEAEEDEVEALEFNHRVQPGELRLACQIAPIEDITVHKRVKPPA